MSGAFDSLAMRKRLNKTADIDLIRAIVATIPLGHAVVDLGAGNGRNVRALRDAGYDVVGVDGGENVEQLTDGLVSYADLTRPLHITQRDWGICIEVGEHIPPELLPGFLNVLSFAASTGLILSWAVPGQRGRNHVSCRLPEWVASQLGLRGWALSDDLTNEARRIAGGDWARKLLVFVRPYNVVHGIL